MTTYEEALRKVEFHENALREAKNAANRILNSCKHEFGEAVNCSRYEPGYTCPGDEPGTMGVDFRGPIHVPGRMVPEWKRTCKKCGFTQHTKVTETTTVLKPKFD